MVETALEPTELETLQEARKQAWKTLLVQLRRFRWAYLPRKNDPDGVAARNDPAVVEAARALQQIDSKLYRLRHLAKCRETDHRQYLAHRQRAIDRAHDYYEAYPYKAAEYSARWRRNNPDRAAEFSARWRQNNPEAVNMLNRHRRAKLLEAKGSFTVDDFRELCQKSGNQCAYCGRLESEVGPLTPDHMIPLSRGGSNDLDNILPCCSRCNSSKGALTTEEYLLRLNQHPTEDSK